VGGEIGKKKVGNRVADALRRLGRTRARIADEPAETRRLFAHGGGGGGGGAQGRPAAAGRGRGARPAHEEAAAAATWLQWSMIFFLIIWMT
jgi:hypothetical protein